MPVLNPSLVQFNTGEITPFLGGRTDYKKYGAAAEYMENCIPLVYGPFIKRSGTRFVNSIRTYGTKVILKPFIFSKSQAYTLEIGVKPLEEQEENKTGYIRFHTKNGTIVGLNNLPIEVDTPFTEEDLDNLDFAQSNDFLYIASGRLPVKILKRHSHTSWTLESLSFVDGPYQDENTDKSLTIKTSATAVGSAATLTASRDLFTADMVGLPIRLRKVAVGSSTDNAIGWGTITAVTNGTTATCLVEEQFFSNLTSQPTYAWRIGEFSSSRKYPKKVTIFKGRLVLASTEARPNTLWLSKSDSYHDFGPTNLLDNEVLDDSAIYMTMAATETNQIQWLAALRQLFVGTLGTEFKIGNLGEVLTPSKATSEEVSQYGSTSIKPCKYANELVYVQQAGRKVRTMYYDLSTDAYNSQDLSLFGEHLTFGGIAGIVQQIEPYSTIWAWLNNGKLRSISYDKSQEVCAWSRQVLGGTKVRVLSACCIPFIEENRDQLWLLVERWINGQFVQYIETMDRVFDDQVSQAEGYFVDCGGTWNQPINITNMESDGANTILTCPDHGLTTGVKIRISEIENYSENNFTEEAGFEQLNDKNFYITVVDEDTISIEYDSSELIPYISWQGGVIRGFIIAINNGIDHLEGEEVYAVVDGAISPLRKVVNGRVELDSPGTIVHIGLPYKCKYKSVRFETNLGNNDALAAKQKIHHVYAQIYRTNYFKYGAETLNEIMPARKYGTDKMDTAPSLKSGLVEIALENAWSHEPKITLESDLPLPLCILRLTTQMSINI
jgi:hypothetical protein